MNAIVNKKSAVGKRLAEKYPFEGFTVRARSDEGFKLLDHHNAPDYLLREVLPKPPYSMSNISAYTKLIRNHGEKLSLMIETFKHFDHILDKSANHRIYWFKAPPKFMKLKTLMYSYSENTASIVRGSFEEQDNLQNILEAIQEIHGKFNVDMSEQKPLFGNFKEDSATEIWLNFLESSNKLNNTHEIVRGAVAVMPQLPEPMVQLLSNDESEMVRIGLADSAFVDSLTLDKLSKDKSLMVQRFVLFNENTSAETLMSMFDKSFANLKGNDNQKGSSGFEWDSLVMKNSVKWDAVPQSFLNDSFNEVLSFFGSDSELFLEFIRGLALNKNLSFETIYSLVELEVKDLELLFNLLTNTGVPETFKSLVLDSMESIVEDGSSESILPERF